MLSLIPATFIVKNCGSRTSKEKYLLPVTGTLANLSKNLQGYNIQKVTKPKWTELERHIAWSKAATHLLWNHCFTRIQFSGFCTNACAQIYDPCKHLKLLWNLHVWHNVISPILLTIVCYMATDQFVICKWWWLIEGKWLQVNVLKHMCSKFTLVQI